MGLIRSFSLVWLFMAASALAQSDNASVLDTNGHPLERGQEYYIKPAITDVGGRITLINRDGSCPWYVGQENSDVATGLPVVFKPFAEDDDIVKVNRDTMVEFSGATTCAQSTEWKLGVNDTQIGRRLIITGRDENDDRLWDNYFRIEKAQIGDNIYNLAWCPTEVCPFCRFICGTAGGVSENGKILLALDGNVLPVVFEKA